MSRLKQLKKDSIIYGLGGVLGKAVGFILLPVYTRIFSPAEYGFIEMFTIIGSLVASIVAMGMDSGQSFYFFKEKGKGKQEQAKIVSSIAQWKLLWGVFVIAITTAISPFLNSWFFDGKLDWAYFAVTFSGVLFSQIMRQSAEVLRLIFRPWHYISLILAQTLISAALVFSLVVFFELGIFGYLVGSTIASCIVAIVGWIIIRDYLDLRKTHFNLWPRLLRFGIPLLPASLSMYVMNTADRWFIQHYYGEQELGLYAIGAKFALLLAFVVETFRRAWWPIAMDAMHSEDGPETYRMIAQGYMGVGTSGVVYLAFLSPWLLEIMVADAYHEAYPIIGILAWQSLFYGFYLIGAAGIWKAEKTKYSAIFFIIGAFLNIALNYILVPKLGGLGAALSTSFVFFTWTAISLIVSERLWYIGFPVKTMLVQIIVGTCTVAWLISAYRWQLPNILIATVTHIVFFFLLLSSTNLNRINNFVKKIASHETSK
jgi:O-antigen/teichoic acid export membrane protein